MPKKSKNLGYGLNKAPHDPRDFQLGAILPKVDINTLPEEFSLETLEVKDQKNTDFCGAYSATTLSEMQEGVLLSPEYLFAKAKQIEGDYTTWGSDLRLICRAVTKYGNIEQKDSPLNIENKDRDHLANWKNWPTELDEKAKKHAKKSYFSITGQKDVYDSIKVAIWSNKPNTGVLTGALWRSEWTNAQNGIIPDRYGDSGFGHAYTYIGWKKIEGVEYLVAQLSNGTGIGDQGKFYFSRKICNLENTYGNYCLIDMPVTKAKILSFIPIKANWIHRVLDFINGIIKIYG